MKRLGCFSLLLGAAFFAGILYCDWAHRQLELTINLENLADIKRMKDGEYEYSRVKTLDGRKVVLMWHR